ncbi:DUF1844 domain-containing protein [Desulfovibrio litoralis]|uniref:DUF1844 domain-containing protein n=1 Tax=Desulfovibrio litoralis DSM 11393 TaxID=1121455 RepID=A0A1M7RT07_9BACT|nr:DUF1844 domain-containing protein [Desulfovibrio litoralis]SHN49425.1 protein of unknown function [Desulfovibrio litoralis DSM 11393]
MSENNQNNDATAEQNALPQVNFSTFVLSIASSTLLNLGEVPNPETGKTEQNLLMAKHSIDLLSMLQDKLINGVSDDEKKLLADLLYEVRMKYVLKNK